jgi:hypothetical protein
MTMPTTAPVLSPDEDPEDPFEAVPDTLKPDDEVVLLTVAAARPADWILLCKDAWFASADSTEAWFDAASPVRVTVDLTCTPLRREVAVFCVTATSFLLTPAVVATPWINWFSFVPSNSESRTPARLTVDSTEEMVMLEEQGVDVRVIEHADAMLVN